MLCNICKKNPAVIFSSKEVDGKRVMEGLCINCAKKQGINTDEILKAQNEVNKNNQSQNMNVQLEGLFKNLAESLNNIDGLEFDATPFVENYDNSSNDESDENSNPNVNPIFAGAIPLGSIFGEFGGFRPQNSSDEISNGNVKKKVKPEKKSNKAKRKKYLDTYGTNLTLKAKNKELDMVIGREKELQRVIQILNRRTKNEAGASGQRCAGLLSVGEK